MVIGKIDWYIPHWKDPLYWIKAIITGIIARVVMVLLGFTKVYNFWHFITSTNTIYFAIAVVVADYIMFYIANYLKKKR